MDEKTQYNSTSIAASPQEEDIEDYSLILDKFLINYKIIDQHLVVGQITKTQGWILHLSVVRWQIAKLIQLILPKLIAANAPFKLVRNKNLARMTLDGNLDLSQVGKVITVYPDTDDVALALAKDLITLTTAFKGPDIPTDLHLGSILYTRYGSFRPIVLLDVSGKPVNHIYDNVGNLIPDVYHIPFKLPSGISWPFSTLVSPLLPISTQKGKSNYKSIAILKSDAKGNVLKALRVSGFKIGWCIIKEAKKNMWSDEADRDMTDRLLWQREIHNVLHKKIHIPKIFDFYYNNGDAYLVMEYINGESVFKKRQELNFDSLSWFALNTKSKLTILNYLLQIISIIKNLHQNGYVHRDITPVNFLVNRRNKVYAIDNELTYSLSQKKPMPPFKLGTDGFMSPEQIETKPPSIKEDIYGLGATMISMLTGFSPLLFINQDQYDLRKHLHFFIADIKLANTISACLDSAPQQRPTLSSIEEDIEDYKSHLADDKKKTIRTTEKTDEDSLRRIVTDSINGLVSFPTLTFDNIWVSRMASSDPSGRDNESFCASVGLYEGIIGILYLLSKAKMMGINITHCDKSCKKSWKFIQENYASTISSMKPGLYGGAAGIALGIALSIQEKIIEDDTVSRKIINDCLSISAADPTVAYGISGQGIALLQCRPLLNTDFFNQTLKKYEDGLQIQLLQNKKWNSDIRSNNEKITAGLSYGNGGILYFLLEYWKQNKNINMEKLISLLLSNINKRQKTIKSILKKYSIAKILHESPLLFDEIRGLVLSLTKAYEVLGNITYKESAENILQSLPKFITCHNLSQETGLTELGEIYLEVHTATGNEEWINRAIWIQQSLINTINKNVDGYVYWLNKNSKYATADFMGSSGIIHFLLRFLMPDKIGYRFLK